MNDVTFIPISINRTEQNRTEQLFIVNQVTVPGYSQIAYGTFNRNAIYTVTSYGNRGPSREAPLRGPDPDQFIQTQRPVGVGGNQRYAQKRATMHRPDCSNVQVDPRIHCPLKRKRSTLARRDSVDIDINM